MKAWIMFYNSYINCNAMLLIFEMNDVNENAQRDVRIIERNAINWIIIQSQDKCNILKLLWNLIAIK